MKIVYVTFDDVMKVREDLEKKSLKCKEKTFLKCKEGTYDRLECLTILTARKIIDRLEEIKVSKDKLYVFLLPELWMYKDSVIEGGQEYKIPFSKEEVEKNLLQKSVFCMLTREYENLLLCPGTVWWEDERVLFQSAPVYWQGECIVFWDKQTLSDKDGVGPVENVDNADRVMQWKHFRMDRIESEEVCAAKFTEDLVKYIEQEGPIRSTLALNRRGRGNAFEIEYDKRQISFTIEICLDVLYRVTQSMGIAPPQVQLIVSSELSFTYGDIYTQGQGFWCDSSLKPYFLWVVKSDIGMEELPAGIKETEI